jgi:hypothetical protein
MEKKAIVKARAHHGSKSFDITIPVNICKTFTIAEGDVFSVETVSEHGKLKIIYTRIFQQQDKSI